MGIASFILNAGKRRHITLGLEKDEMGPEKYEIGLEKNEVGTEKYEMGPEKDGMGLKKDEMETEKYEMCFLAARSPTSVLTTQNIKKKKKKGDMQGTTMIVSALRPLHQRCLAMPSYTVVVPRPHKPPLVNQSLHSGSNDTNIDRNNIDHLTPNKPSTFTRITGFSKPKRAVSRKADKQRRLQYTASMSLVSPLTHVPDLYDESISLQFSGIQDDSSIFTYTESNDMNVATMLHQPRYSSFPNLPGNRTSQKRVYGAVTEPDRVESQHRRKMQKQNRTHINVPLTEVLQSTSLHPQPPNNTHRTDPRTTTLRKENFACPFHKNNSVKYTATKVWKSCIGPNPGWSIHRLKEHIHRNHFAGYRCSRCLMKFESPSILHEHQRSETPCHVQNRDDTRVGEIDEAQWAQIRKRSRRLTEVERWNEIYRIIFRLGPTAEIPSPFYENITPDPSMKKHQPYGIDSLSSFEVDLHCLLMDCSGQQDRSEIQACLKRIHGYRERQYLSMSLFQIPPVVPHNGDFLSLPLEYQSSTESTISSDENNDDVLHNFQDMDVGDINTLNGLVTSTEPSGQYRRAF
ncbi:hypothetical protein F5Y19DRAFT_454288 [Xylariaceae sp. FL1651]|nr:hypothetical protein F5Y19DRAFT_454288 [Xylariaceae sp. FL1651]